MSEVGVQNTKVLVKSGIRMGYPSKDDLKELKRE